MTIIEVKKKCEEAQIAKQTTQNSKNSKLKKEKKGEVVAILFRVCVYV